MQLPALGVGDGGGLVHRAARVFAIREPHEVADLVQKTRGNTVLVNHAADAARANSEQAAALQGAVAVFQLQEGDAAVALEAPARPALTSRA